MKGTIPVNMKGQSQEEKTRSRVYEMIVQKIHSTSINSGLPVDD